MFTANTIIAIIISYFLGNISMSIIISKVCAGIDIREHGSGNAGTTNVLRTLGKKAAVLTLLGDILKGVVAVIIGRYLGGEILAMICGIAAVIGHIWPVVFGFKGGKGIATGIGIMFSTVPLAASICLVLGVLFIVFTRYVSLGSITGALSLPIVIYFYDKNYLIWALVLSIIAVYGHRGNIKRLISGTESKVKF